METDLHNRSIEGPASTCVQSFNQCLAHSAHLPSRQQSALGDQMGIFTICIADMGLRPACGSLDCRLRDYPDLRRLTGQLLWTVNERIQGCLSCILDCDLLADEGTTENKTPSLDTIDTAIKSVADEISLLHQLSVTLRTVGSKEQTVNAGTFFYLREEDGHAMIDYLRRRFPSCSRGIRKRLTAAMLLRQYQILRRRASSQSPSPTSAKHAFDTGRVGTGVNHERVDWLPAPLGPIRRILAQTITPEKEITEAICPYCCFPLPSATVLDKIHWMNHAKHDLGLYVCLFESCNTPNALYNHLEDWMKHLRQHKRWRCASASHGILVFHTQREYEEHIISSHKSFATQMAILSKRSSRSYGPLFQSCPFCGQGQAEVETSMEVHVADHLDYLALNPLTFEDIKGSKNFHHESILNFEQTEIPSRSTSKDDSDCGVDYTTMSPGSVVDDNVFTSNHGKEPPSPGHQSKEDASVPNDTDKILPLAKSQPMDHNPAKPPVTDTTCNYRGSILPAIKPESPHRSVGISAVSTNEEDTAPETSSLGSSTRPGFNTHTHTHQHGRLLTCPIITCKSRRFHRNQDRTYHLFSHYKKNMACAFCPQSGSQNCFDAYGLQSHLKTFHRVNELPASPHESQQSDSSCSAAACAVKTDSATNNNDATGMCSICAVPFDHTQAFYEHLVDCVARAVERNASSENTRLSQIRNERQRTARSERRSREALVRRFNAETLRRGEE